MLLRARACPLLALLALSVSGTEAMRGQPRTCAEIMSKARRTQGEIWFVQVERCSQVLTQRTMDYRTAASVRLEVADQEASSYLPWAAGDSDCSAGGVKKRSCAR